MKKVDTHTYVSVYFHFTGTPPTWEGTFFAYMGQEALREVLMDSRTVS